MLKEIEKEFINPSVKSNAQALFIKGESDKVHFKSGFDFLRQHKGYRLGHLHLFIAPSGAGKSSLFFAQIFDLMRENAPTYTKGAKIGVYLSEEKIKRFQTSLVKMGLYGDKSKITDCIRVFSEKDFKSKHKIEKLHYTSIVEIIRKFIEKENINILFIDNLTTMDCYLDDRHDEISPLAKNLSYIADDFNIPLIIYAHTGGDIGGADFNMEDIRQKKTITHLAEYCYLIHRFQSTSINSYIHTRKHRGSEIKSYYHQMIFNPEMGIIDRFIPSSLASYKAQVQAYKEIGKERNEKNTTGNYR